LGRPNSEKIYNLIGKIGDSDAAATLDAVEDLINTGLGEVQIIDSLVEYMRDLMVAKSAGADTELLILTAEQRKHTGRLAEKFDTAALIYNITALEKLRWSVKNSDNARALLEASLLRFALSEHFLNVDALLSQLRGNSATPIKKKQPTSVKTEPTSEHRESSIENQASSIENQASSIENRESSIENRASSIENRASSIEYRASSNQQQDKLETTAGRQQTNPSASRPKTKSQRQNEIINDPAVKTVLMGLDATITAIEED